MLRDINRSVRYGLSPLKAFGLPGKTKLIQGTLVKQMEDIIYEMFSIKVKIQRRREIESRKKSLSEEGALELGLSGW